MSDTSLVFNLVARDRASEDLDKIKAKFVQVGGAIGKLAGASMALPGLAAVVAGGAALALSFMSAGVAVKAFTMAAGPQMASVTASWDLYGAAQDAAAKGGKEAAAAQKAYTDALAAMSPATRATAKSFIGLKSDFSKWSDSLSGTTMPVFTKGIEILRDLLPMLTPFVKSAGAALSGFLDNVAKGVQSAGFKGFATDLARLSGPTLTGLLTSLKNVGVGLGGMLAAFMPVSSGMGSGMTDLTAKFAAWGQSLKDSEGFAKFLDMVSTGGDTLGTLGGAAVNLLTAVSPLIGTTAMLANGLAKIINSTPAPVLTALAAVLVTVKLGMMAYSLVTTIVAAKNRIMAMSQTPVILGWIRMNAVGVASMARIAVASTVSAATTAAAWVGSALVSIGTWIAAVVRAGITAAAQFVMMAARAVAWAVVMAAQWLIAMGPIGWIIAAVIALAILIYANWDKIKAATAAVWNWVWAKLKAFGSWAIAFFMKWNIVSVMIRAWEGVRSGVVSKATALIGWLRGLPGRITSALGSFHSMLVSKGVAVVQGLWSGIQSMGGWIKGQIMSWARDVIPGPIAKALGIASPSKVTKAQGAWIGRGLVDGLTGTTKQVKTAAQKLADIVRSGMASGKKKSAALGKISAGSKQLVALANREVTLAARMKTATKAVADQIKARDKLAADVKKGVLDAANITTLESAGGTSASTILAGLNTKLQQAKQFAAQLATLRKKGVRADLIAQIAQAGVEQGSGAANALASASASQIKQINATQAQLVTAAGAAGATAGDAMYGAGIQAAQGVVAGLKSQQKAIEQQMLAIAKGMSKSIKKALGIKSPSKLMADQVGSMVPAGIIGGINDGQGALDRRMAAVVQAPPSSATAGLARQMAPQAAPLMAGSGGTQVIRIEVAGPEEVKKFIRAVVRKDGRGNVQLAFGQGKG